MSFWCAWGMIADREKSLNRDIATSIKHTTLKLKLNTDVPLSLKEKRSHGHKITL